MTLPSASENFGNAVLEAMAYAMPVVVTPTVGLADDIEASGCGIVTPADPAPLAAAIERILSDSALGAEMGRRGRALAEAKFQWKAIAAAMEEKYATC